VIKKEIKINLKILCIKFGTLMNLLGKKNIINDETSPNATKYSPNLIPNIYIPAKDRVNTIKKNKRINIELEINLFTF
jgi:hypothetical protein|tara:strand:- start:9823 stop:10056 length:234 start_codon:yes stop_codon:yes gene_type:complete